MANTRGKGGQAAKAPGRGRPRTHKASASKALKSKSRKPEPAKPSFARPKAAPASGATGLKRQLKAARLQQEASANEAREALERQTATADILKVIASSPSDVQPVFQAIVTSARRLVGGLTAAVYRFVDGLAHRVTATPLNPAADEALRNAFPRPIDEIGHFRRAAAGELVQIADTEVQPDTTLKEVARSRGYRGILFVPLKSHGGTIGTLTVTRSDPGPFSAHHVQLLQTFADQAVIAIENARLFNETQEALERQTATADILRVISQSPTEVQPVFDAIVATAVKLLRCHRAFIQLCDGVNFWAVALCGPDGPLPPNYTAPVPIDPAANFPSRAIVEKKTLHLPDWSVIDLPEWERGVRDRLGLNSALFLPLLRDDECIGVLAAAGKDANIFDANDIALAESFRDQALIAIENARLFNEVQTKSRDLQEALRYQTGSANILNVIASSPTDVEPVLEAIVKSACELCEAHDAVVLLKDGDDLCFSAHHGPVPINTDRWPIGQGWASGRAVVDRAIVHVHDTLAEEDFTDSRELSRRAGSTAVRSVLAAPLLREGESIGAILLRRQEVRPFNDKQIAMLETFADQAVIAIDNARLFDEVQAKTRDLEESLQQQTATAHVLKVISRSAFDLQAVFDTLARSAADLCAVRLCGLHIREGDVLVCRGYAGATREQDEFARRTRISVGDSNYLMSRALASGEIVNIGDFENDTTMSPQARTFQQILGFKALLFVPLLREGHGIGLFVLGRDSVGAFSQRHIDLVQTFADQAVIAIENVRLFDETQEALERQTATSEVLNVIAGSPTDIQPVFNAIARSAVELCEGTNSGIFLLQDGLVHFVGHHNLSPKQLASAPKAFPAPLHRGYMAGRAILGRAVAHVPDIAADPEYTAEAMVKAGFRSAVSVPMFRNGEPIGAINVTREEARPFTDRQIELLKTFADQAVIAIENTRLFKEVQAKTRELTARNSAYSEQIDHQSATIEILKAMSASPGDAQPVFDIIVRRAMQICSADIAVVLELKNALVYLHAIAVDESSTSPGIVEAYRKIFPQPPSRDSVALRAIFHGEIIHIPNMAEDLELSQASRDIGPKGALAIPLVRDGKVIGSIGLSAKVVGGFSQVQIELLKTFAEQAVIAIRSAETFRQLHTRTSELTESLQQQTATADVLKVISRSAFDLEPALVAICETAARLSEADQAAIFRREGESDLYHFAASFGFPKEYGTDWRAAGPRTIDPLTPLPGARSVAERRPVHVLDLAADPAFHRTASRQSQARTALGIPLLRNGEPIGNFVLGRRRVEAFTDRQIELVQTFADQAVIAIENTRLFNETQEALEQQTATSEVLQAIASSMDDSRPVFERILDSTMQLFDCRQSALMLAPGDGLIHLGARRGPGSEVMDRIYPRPIGETMAATIIDQRRQTYIADVMNDPDVSPSLRQIAEAIGNLSIVMTPMIWEGRAIGMISVGREPNASFDAKELNLLSTFADQAVIAIQNARLFNETREALAYQTGSSNVLRVIASSPTDVAPVLNAIVESARELCEAIDAVVLLKDGEHLRFSAHSGPLPITVDKWPIGRGWTAGRAFVDQKPVHVRDMLSEEGADFPDARLMGQRTGVSIHTVLSVPLLRGDESIGAILLRRGEVRPFIDKQISLLSTFADQAVIAIQNTRLFNETKEALSHQTATSDVLQTIGSSMADAQPVFERILDITQTLFNTKQQAILLAPGDGLLYAAAFRGPHGEAFKALYPIPIEPTAAFASIREGRQRYIADALNGADASPLSVRTAQAIGNFSLVVTPMVWQGRPIGVINVSREPNARFTDKELTLLRTFADQAVIAIENTRLFNETKEALERQTATADILKVIASSPSDTQPVFEAIAERSNRLIGGLSTAVYSIVDDVMHLMAFTPSNPEADAALRASFPRPLSEAAWGDRIRNREIVEIPDAQAEWADEPGLRDLARLRGFRSLLFVPLLRDGVTIGIISVSRRELGRFAPHHVQLLQTFADQAVIAIGNVELFKQVQQRTLELSKSLDDLRTAQDRLVQTEKLASLGQLTAGIAHEIKNPLNFVNNFSALSVELIDEMTEAFENPALDEAARRKELDDIRELLKGNLEKVVQHGKRADSIVKNMLLHSREGSGERRASDLNALVSESLNLAYHGARAERSDFNITLEQHLDPDAGAVEVYPQELTRALLNLISNGFYAAVRRKMDGASATFEPVLSAATKSAGEAVEIRIRDNGTGIPAEIREKIFNPFFTTKPTGEGTGLGLSMTHDIIVKQHSGRIDVETEPGIFTEFIITLPRGNGSAVRSKPE